MQLSCLRDLRPYASSPSCSEASLVGQPVTFFVRVLIRVVMSSLARRTDRRHEPPTGGLPWYFASGAPGSNEAPSVNRVASANKSNAHFRPFPKREEGDN